MARCRVRAQCKYTGPSGTRCKTLVPVALDIRFPRGGKYAHYCSVHEAAVLAQTTMTIQCAVPSLSLDYTSYTAPRTYFVTV